MFAKTMSKSEVELGNGVNGAPIYVTINGKVREFVKPPGSKEWDEQVAQVKNNGHHAEIPLAKMLYDPKYGSPNKIEDVTREHAAYCEDSLYYRLKGQNKLADWKTIALFAQPYRE